MKFRTKQFASGYVYFSFEAKTPEEAAQLVAEINLGNDVSVELKQEGFDAEDGSEMRLVK